jgi:hypothetical protein
MEANYPVDLPKIFQAKSYQILGFSRNWNHTVKQGN